MKAVLCRASPAVENSRSGYPGDKTALQKILDMLILNKEPFNNNEWRREPWPAKPYAVIPDYEVKLFK